MSGKGWRISAMTNYDLEGPQREIPACHKHVTHLDPSADEVSAVYRCIGSACAKWVPEGVRHALRCGDSVQDAFVTETVAPSTTGACEDTPNSLPWLDPFAEAKAQREQQEAEARADQQASVIKRAAAFAKGFTSYKIPQANCAEYTTYQDSTTGVEVCVSRVGNDVVVATHRWGHLTFAGVLTHTHEMYVEVTDCGKYVRLG